MSGTRQNAPTKIERLLNVWLHQNMKTTRKRRFALRFFIDDIATIVLSFYQFTFRLDMTVPFCHKPLPAWGALVDT